MQSLQFDPWRMEIITPNYLLRASLRPRGDLMIYLNNLTYHSFFFEDVEMLPFSPDYQFKGVKQPAMTINRVMMTCISILEPDKAAQIQVLQAKRPILFYTDWFAVRGDLHVNSEAPDENMFDDKFEFFILTDASIYPLRPMAVKPKAKVPALVFSRKTLVAYHVHHA
jgi:hypothetical protein